jgi:hypothetical protein
MYSAEVGNVREFGTYSFANCPSLESINLDADEIIIRTRAFADATGLTSLWLGTNVSAIEKHAFDGCNNLIIDADYPTEDEIPEAWDDEFAGSGTVVHYYNVIYDENPDFYMTYDEELDCYYVSGYRGPGGDVVLPTVHEEKPVLYVKSIGSGYADAKITSLTIPECYEYLYDLELYNHGSLQSVTILSPHITVIPHSFFAACESLTSVSLPATVTEIEDSAFYGCAVLSDFVLPASVNIIGADAFRGCKNLTIQAYPNSYAAQYAKENNIKLEII